MLFRSYFGIGNIDEDQLQDFIRRSGRNEAEVRRGTGTAAGLSVQDGAVFGPVVFSGLRIQVSGIKARSWRAARSLLIRCQRISDACDSTEPDCSHAAHAGRNALSNEAMARDTALE